MFKKPFIAAALASACSFASADNPDITVTYSNFSQPLSQTTGQVRIIGREEIELLGTLSVDQLLNQISGISVSSQGGLGQVSSIRMRGSDTGDVLVLIDGVSITDTTDIDLNPKTSILNSLNIERIEIVKGNQSAVWGSQALGGVINIITSDDDRQVTRAEFGVGSYGQRSTRVKSNWGNDSTQISVSAGYLAEDGFSALERRFDGVNSRDEAQAGLEKDPYRERSITFITQTAISENQTLRASFFDVTSHTNYDDHFTPDFNDTSTNTTDLTQFILTHEARGYSNSVFKTQASKTFNERSQFGGYKGSQAMLSHRYQQHRDQKSSSYGFTLIRDELKLQAGTGVSAPQMDTYELNTVQNWPVGTARFDLAVAYQIRSEFENGATYRLGFKNQVDPSLALGGSFSTGFKTPSLYQLSCSGNTGAPNYNCFVAPQPLNPEESSGTEVFADTPFGIWTVFQSEVTNRIDYANSVYFNDTGKSKTNGWEYSHQFDSLESVSHSISHTYVNAEDASGAKRVRIPETETTFRTLWVVSDPLLIGLDIRHTGSRLGNSDDLETGNFTVSDLFGTYRLSAKTSLNMRIENLTDTFYQDAVNASSGYATRGRGYYFTLQSEF
jgi:vitamin B12 transporter